MSLADSLRVGGDAFSSGLIAGVLCMVAVVIVLAVGVTLGRARR